MTTQLKKPGTFKEVRTGLQRNVAQANELARAGHQDAVSQASVAKASLDASYAVEAAQGDQRRAMTLQNLDAARKQLVAAQAEFDAACMHSIQLAADVGNGKARVDAQAVQRISELEEGRKKAVRGSYAQAFNKLAETASDKLEFGMVVVADRTVALVRGIGAFFNISAASERYKQAYGTSTINVPEKFKASTTPGPNP